jgi:hypothetical protein
LELFRFVGLLIRKTFQNILYFIYTALKIHKDSGRCEAHMGNGKVPDGADEGVNAAAADNVAGEMEGTTGTYGSRL